MDETTSPQLDELEEDFGLGDDIEDIPPLTPQDTKISKMIVDYFGRQYEVYNTNNLWATFASWWRIQNPEVYGLQDIDKFLIERGRNQNLDWEKLLLY